MISGISLCFHYDQFGQRKCCIFLNFVCLEFLSVSNWSDLSDERKLSFLNWIGFSDSSDWIDFETKLNEIQNW